LDDVVKVVLVCFQSLYDETVVVMKFCY